jgi:hypothetical protein
VTGHQTKAHRGLHKTLIQASGEEYPVPNIVGGGGRYAPGHRVLRGGAKCRGYFAPRLSPAAVLSRCMPRARQLPLGTSQRWCVSSGRAVQASFNTLVPHVQVPRVWKRALWHGIKTAVVTRALTHPSDFRDGSPPRRI